MMRLFDPTNPAHVQEGVQNFDGMIIHEKLTLEECIERWGKEASQDFWYSRIMPNDFEVININTYSNMNGNEALKQQAGTLGSQEPDPFSSIRKQSAQAGVDQGPGSMNKPSEPNWMSYPPEDKVGIVRAVFSDFAKPSYGYQQGMSYRLMVYSSGRQVAIWDTEGGQFRVAANYQSWKEFLRNWTKITYIHPADTLLDEIDRLEKTSEANRDSLRKLRSEVQDFKYGR